MTASEAAMVTPSSRVRDSSRLATFTASPMIVKVNCRVPPVSLGRRYSNASAGMSGNGFGLFGTRRFTKPMICIPGTAIDSPDALLS